MASGTLADLATSDAPPEPSPGEGVYYVRAQSACGSGTYGTNSASVERALPAACPRE